MEARLPVVAVPSDRKLIRQLLVLTCGRRLKETLADTMCQPGCGCKVLCSIQSHHRDREHPVGLSPCPSVGNDASSGEDHDILLLPKLRNRRVVVEADVRAAMLSLSIRSSTAYLLLLHFKRSSMIVTEATGLWACHGDQEKYTQ